MENDRFEGASTEFPEASPIVLDYVSKSATDRADAISKEALQNINHLAVNNTKKFEKVEMWARLEEQARGRLEEKVEKEKARN